MEVESCAFPGKPILDPHGNKALPSNSVSKCGTLDQSKGRDLPIFKPLNMKTVQKKITFKSVNMPEKLNLSKPVAMVRPLPMALVKPLKKVEVFAKSFQKKLKLIAEPEIKNDETKNLEKQEDVLTETFAKLENEMPMQNTKKGSKSISALTTPLLENQCRDCLKVLATKKSVMEHKIKFRCPVNRFGTISQNNQPSRNMDGKKDKALDKVEKKPSVKHDEKEERPQNQLPQQEKRQTIVIPKCQASSSNEYAYMQKTCDVTEKAIWPKKNCGKSA